MSLVRHGTQYPKAPEREFLGTLFPSAAYLHKINVHMKNVIYLLLGFFLFLAIIPSVFVARAQGSEVYYKAQVEKILDQGEETSFCMTAPYQHVVLRMLDGDMSGRELAVDHGRGLSLDKSQLVQVGDTVLVMQYMNADNVPVFQIVDTYRLDRVVPIILFFFLGILLLSGWKGIGSIIGMIISLGVIAQYIVPQILAGKDPLFVSVVGCLIIMISTIYLAHGFSKKTTIALVSTFITLVITGLLSILFVKLTQLTGLGSEDAYSLKLGPTANINFQGLLLGGILIGALGVLDDVTTGLSASVFEIAKANPTYSFHKLFASGLVIGREHIASLVNTLVLAYAGASLPIFIIIALNPNNTPMHIILNDGLIVEEIIRTLAGSIGLVLAVPLTTMLAAYYANKAHAS